MRSICQFWSIWLEIACTIPVAMRIVLRVGFVKISTTIAIFVLLQMAIWFWELHLWESTSFEPARTSVSIQPVVESLIRRFWFSCKAYQFNLLSIRQSEVFGSVIQTFSITVVRPDSVDTLHRRHVFFLAPQCFGWFLLGWSSTSPLDGVDFLKAS